MIANVANVTRGELLRLAKERQEQVKGDQTFVYQRAYKNENDFFVKMLDAAPDGTLQEMRASAMACSQAQSKKARIASIGGLVLMLGSAFAPLPASLSMLRLVGMIGGMYIGMAVSGRAAQAAGDQKYFASQLGEWQRSLDAAAGTPAPPQPAPQPAPQPEQPAPQPAPAS